MNDNISGLVSKLCESLNTLWGLESYSFTYSSYSNVQESYAKTTYTPSAHRLPKTEFAVRGHDGVELTYPSVEMSSSQVVSELICQSYNSQNHVTSNAYQKESRAVSAAVDELMKFIDDDEELSFRLYGVIGYKTYSWDEFVNSKASRNLNSAGRWYFLTIADILADALISCGFDSAKRDRFERWNEVSALVVDSLNKLSDRTEYSYEVRIYLNGPPVDSTAEYNVAALTVDDTPVDMKICAATDALIAPLVRYKPHPSAERINTVLKYTFSVPVKVGEGVYVKEYANAALIAEFVIDSLRLIRPKDDIGVLAINVEPTSELTPSIREPDENRYHAGLARFQPRRFDYSPSSLHALEEDEIEMVRKIVNSRLPKKPRFEYAIGRLRNSIERYPEDDPERLLEWAIALESLYLNDNTNDQAELTYRLSLRAARYLEDDRDARERVFLLVKNLYSLRSKIAHGSDINQITKEGEKKKLLQVMDLVPDIVANSIIRLLEASENEETNSIGFWRDVELS